MKNGLSKSALRLLQVTERGLARVDRIRFRAGAPICLPHDAYAIPSESARCALKGRYNAQSLLLKTRDIDSVLEDARHIVLVFGVQSEEAHAYLHALLARVLAGEERYG
jgi:hypothetical protein